MRVLENIANTRQHLASRVRRSAFRAKRRTSHRWLSLRGSVLGRAVTATERSSKISGAFSDLAARAASTNIDDYDTLTAKALVAAIKDIGAVPTLVRIGLYEEANKNRKTVLGAVEQRLDGLEPEVVALRQPVEADAAEVAPV